MHPTFDSIKSELTQVVASVMALPNSEPLNIAHGNWSFPGTTRDELAHMATSLIQLIDAFGGDSASSNDKLLTDYVRRLSFLRANTIPQLWGNAGQAVPPYETTIAGLAAALKEAFQIEKAATKDEALQAIRALKTLQTSIRAIEARVASTDLRSLTLDEKITAIERAHQAADQLPTDLVTLAESRLELGGLLRDSKADREQVAKVLLALKETYDKVEKNGEEATAVLARCDAAYRAATSEGLASAFAERSRGLSVSMWVWVGGLVVALCLGAIFGTSQLQHLMTIVNGQGQAGHAAELWVNLVLAVFSVAGPVWFAWISTKQIGQRFRLAEDYGYKASISKAYEGYRREAALLEPAFQARLFASALTRLEELPLRLVETDTHGSPWHELASSKIVRDAINTVPGFMDKVASLAESAISRLSFSKSASGASDPTNKSA